MKLSALNAWDILVLTLIFFGYPILASTGLYFTAAETAGNQAAQQALQFSAHDNWRSILFKGITLLVAFAYLHWRRFDFSQLNFKLNRYTPVKTLAFILLVGVIAAAFDGIQLFLLEPGMEAEAVAGAEQSAESYGFLDFLAAYTAYLSPPFILFALLNGFFEELYFLGLIFCAEKKIFRLALIFSLFVRFSFHTYQGIDAALTITLLGLVFCLLRLKHKALPPFMLAHSFFDLFGLSYLLNLLYGLWYFLAA